MNKRLILLVSALLAGPALFADGGMWMIHLIDGALEKRMQERGLELSAGEIYNADAPGATVSDAVLSLGFYCTASVISDKGLVITNHHCAFSDISALSTKDNNLLENGFWALSEAEEIPVPGKKVYFLKRVLDVTDEVAETETALKERGERYGTRKLSSILEGKYSAATGLEASLASMWSGEKYYLALYEVYDDLRLVGAPPVAVASFGGDEDNWEWPQHKADFALYRIYKDGVPMNTPRHLKIASQAPKEGDFTMVTGYPGRTQRYTSSSHRVEYLQDVERPLTNRIRKGQMEIIRKWMDADPEVRMKYSDAFFSLSNVQEMQEGEVECFKRFNVAAEKRAEEAELSLWINRDNGRKARWGSMLRDFEAEYASISDIERQKACYRETMVRGTSVARTLLRMANNPATRDSLWNSALKELDPRVEKELLAFSMKEYFDGIDPSFIGDFQMETKARFGDDYAAMTDWLWERPEELMKMVTEVKITAFNDAEKHVADLTALRRDYANALYEMRLEKGVPQAPDANSTMRLSYGRICSLSPRDGVTCSWKTTVRGLREKWDPSKHDFALPEDFMEAIASYDGPVNFLSDNDITGGNSGSPVLNSRGELIGLAFDGNKESLASDVLYTPDYNRCVCVDIRYVLAILDSYAHLDRILKEVQ